MRKNEYQIENQVCSREQGMKLAGLLGDDAPESLWAWLFDEAAQEFILMLKDDGNENPLSLEFDRYYPAYTGDELGALLRNSAKWNEYPCYSTAREKAALAIEGLREGWIKKEEFRYGRS